MNISNNIWQTPPQKLELSNNEAHIWCASLEQEALIVEQLLKILSEDEVKRAERFYLDKHRNRFIIGRGILRTILGRYLKIRPDKLEFCYSDRGKPALTEKSGGETLSFNLSHSEAMAVYAISSAKRIGVDIEYIRPITDAEQIAQRFFSEREYRVLSSLPTNQKQAGFFNCWTRKEAYIKAIGQGLAYSLDQIEVTLVPGEKARIISIAGDTQAADCWSLYELTPNRSYASALAIEGCNWQLKYWACSSIFAEYY